MLQRSTILTVLVGLAVSQSTEKPSCRLEPPNFQRLKKDFQSATRPNFMNNLPGLRPTGPEDIDQSYVAIQKTEYTATQCPGRANATNPALNARTTCPIRWLINTDPNRIPTQIAEVKCSCENCLHFDSENRQTENVCEPVYFYVKALRRVGCQGQFFRYATVNEKIQLACTCAQQYVRNSAGGSSDGPLPSN